MGRADTGEAAMPEGETLRDLLERDATAMALVDAIFASVPSGLTLASAPDVEILRVSDHGSALLQRERNRLEHITAEAHTDAYAVRRRNGEPVAPQDLPLTRATVAGEIVRNEELVLIAEDGTPIDILCNAAPVRDMEGQIVGGIIAWTNITEHKVLQAQLAKALADRETLMREMHHRVKNQLAVLASVVNLQARVLAEDVKDQMKKVADRLQVIAAVQDSFYRGDYGQDVDAIGFLADICNPLQGGAAEIEVAVEAGVTLGPDQAAPVGMIVNEAVCNSLKHAFSGRGDGRVQVSLIRADDGLRLEVADNGPGLPPAPSRASGTQLMTALARQLGGRLELGASAEGGARISVTFGPSPQP